MDDNIRPALNKVQSMVTDFEQVGAVGQPDISCSCCCTLQDVPCVLDRQPPAALPLEQSGYHLI